MLIIDFFKKFDAQPKICNIILFINEQNSSYINTKVSR